jgi:hypothetical protein
LLRASAAVAICLAVALSGTSPTGSAAAEPAVVEVGWWTRLPTQSAPDGGFAVGVAPDGPTSVAAIRLELGDTGVSSASVDVTEAGGTLQALAGLRVCAATSPWTAAAGGPLTDAPAADCSNQAVRLTPGAGGAWQADISPFTAGRTGIISLVVMPEPDSVVAAGLPSAYDVQFEAPHVAAAIAPAAVPAAESAPAPVAGAIPEPSPGFFAPLAPPPDDAPLPSAIGAPADSGTPPLDLPTALAPAADDDGPSPWRWQLLLWLVVLAALVGGAAGALRWSVVSGPLGALVPKRNPLPQRTGP